MASSGPRNKVDAVSTVARGVAEWLEAREALVFWPGAKMTPVQRERAEEAVSDVIRRLKLLVKE